MNTALQTLFNPSTIAVIGVSEDSTKLGSVIYNNIRSAGYTGELYPINPKYREINGVKTYAKLSEVPQSVDLAVIVIPSQYILDVVKDAAKAKTKNLIIISAGFSEIGEEGKKLEEQVYKIAKENGIRIVGPNCLGVITTHSKVNASFASHFPSTGNIAFLSQSGAINTSLLDLALAKGLGFSHFVSLGNKVDVDEYDLIEQWLHDDNVRVIGMYLEEFSQGRKLIDLVQKGHHKPIVALYAGSSLQGRKAAASHTGSMTSSLDVIETAMHKSGILLVDSIEKLFNALILFSWIDDLPQGANVAIVTNAGGPGIMLTDMLSKAGISFAQLDESTAKYLKSKLPPAASINNPIDILGDAKHDRFELAIDAVVNDPNVDAVVTLLTPQYVTEIYETSRTVINAVNKYTKPIIPLFIGEQDILKGLSLMWKNKVPAFQFAEEAVAAYKALHECVLCRDNPIEVPKLELQTLKNKQLVDQVTGKEEIAISPQLTTLLAEEVGIQLPVERVVTTIDDALAFTDANKFPVVLKATTEDAVHKTDTKLIFLNVQNKSDLITNFNELRTNISSLTGKDVPNILIQEMVVGDEELIIGANRDGSSKVYESKESGFGHLLMFGKGGIYTSVYKDVANGLVPLTKQGFTDLISKTNVSQILRGVRGQAPLAEKLVVDMMYTVQALVMMYPQISSLDINPLMVTQDRAVAVDLKIFVKS